MTRPPVPRCFLITLRCAVTTLLCIMGLPALALADACHVAPPLEALGLGFHLSTSFELATYDNARGTGSYVAPRSPPPTGEIGCASAQTSPCIACGATTKPSTAPAMCSWRPNLR